MRFKHMLSLQVIVDLGVMVIIWWGDSSHASDDQNWSLTNKFSLVPYPKHLICQDVCNIVIYEALCFDVTHGRMNGASNEMCVYMPQNVHTCFWRREKKRKESQQAIISSWIFINLMNMQWVVKIHEKKRWLLLLYCFLTSESLNIFQVIMKQIQDSRFEMMRN